MDHQDAFWVERARRGDRAAFGLLVEKHSPALLRGIARRVGDEDAPDLAQETWLQAFLNLDRLRDPARFGAWLGGIGANVARMWLRARRPDGASWEALLDDTEAHPAGNGRSPDEEAALRELRAEVLSALEDLSATNRDAARLHYLDDRSYREVAEQLKIPEKTVKSRLHKAREQLRRRLLHVVELPAQQQGAPSMVDAHVYEVYEVQRASDAPKAAGVDTMAIVVLKAKDRERYLRIWIGGWEAQSIARIMRGAPLPRPMAHELIVQLLSRFGHQVQSVDISALRDNTYYAIMRVSNGTAVEEFDCRPSDALAVGVALGAPIRIAPDVLERSGSDAWDADLKDIEGHIVSSRPLELRDVMQMRPVEPGESQEEERKPL